MNGRYAKMNPGTVSLEKFTSRLRAARDRRLEDVERAQHVVGEDDVRGVVDRLRDRSRVDDDVAAARDRVRGARVGEVDLPVVLGLAGPDPVPRRYGEVGRAHVVARLLQARNERPAHLSPRARDEDLHAQR